MGGPNIFNLPFEITTDNNKENLFLCPPSTLRVRILRSIFISGCVFIVIACRLWTEHPVTAYVYTRLYKDVYVNIDSATSNWS